MKKILICTSFVLALLSTSSVQAQRGPVEFNNYTWSNSHQYRSSRNNQWNNQRNGNWNNQRNGNWNNAGWNNNDSRTALGLAGISALEKIIVTGIVAAAVTSPQKNQPTTTTTNVYNTYVCPQVPAHYEYYIDRKDQAGNWWRYYY